MIKNKGITMADMELVIKISEELYKEQLSSNWTGNILIHDAIVSGVPLPKGHGRLIDADKTIAIAYEAFSTEHYNS